MRSRPPQQLVDLGVAEEAAKASRHAGQGIEQLREGVEHAAESVLGDETAAFGAPRASSTTSPIRSIARSPRRPAANPRTATGAGRNGQDNRNGRRRRASPDGRTRRAATDAEIRRQQRATGPGEAATASTSQQGQQGTSRQGQHGGQGQQGDSERQQATRPAGQQGPAGPARTAKASKATGPARAAGPARRQGHSKGNKGQGQQGQQGQAGSKVSRAGRGRRRRGGNPGRAIKGSRRGRGDSKQAAPPAVPAEAANRLEWRRRGPRRPTGPGGPITGEGFRQWSDRMRDVEELLDDPELRAEAARIRDRVRGAREEFKRHSKEPDWNKLQDLVAEPIKELRNRIAEEVRRRESPDCAGPDRSRSRSASVRRGRAPLLRTIGEWSMTMPSLIWGSPQWMAGRAGADGRRRRRAPLELQPRAGPTGRSGSPPRS